MEVWVVNAAIVILAVVIAYGRFFQIFTVHLDFCLKDQRCISSESAFMAASTVMGIK